MDDTTYGVKGELTIKDVTRPISLEATVEGELANPMGPGRRIGVSVSGQLDRMDFGLNWDGVAGVIPFAGHQIKVQIDCELIATPVAEAAIAG